MQLIAVISRGRHNPSLPTINAQVVAKIPLEDVAQVTFYKRDEIRRI